MILFPWIGKPCREIIIRRNSFLTRFASGSWTFISTLSTSYPILHTLNLVFDACTTLVLSCCIYPILFFESIFDFGLLTVIIAFDFSEAFDTVDHKLFLFKLSHYGFSSSFPLCFCWSLNFLLITSRFTFSSSRSVPSGIPQGSVFRTFLHYLLYLSLTYPLFLFLPKFLCMLMMSSFSFPSSLLTLP